MRSSMKKAYSLVSTAKAKEQEAVQSLYLKVLKGFALFVRSRFFCEERR